MFWWYLVVAITLAVRSWKIFARGLRTRRLCEKFERQWNDTTAEFARQREATRMLRFGRYRGANNS